MERALLAKVGGGAARVVGDVEPPVKEEDSRGLAQALLAQAVWIVVFEGQRFVLLHVGSRVRSLLRSCFGG